MAVNAKLGFFLSEGKHVAEVKPNVKTAGEPGSMNSIEILTVGAFYIQATISKIHGCEGINGEATRIVFLHQAIA